MRLYKTYILTFALLMFCSCEDFLTEVPETAVPESEAMTNLDSAEEVLVGIYSCLKNSSLYSGDLVQATDIQTDLLYAAIGYTNQFGNFYRWEVNANDATLLNVYGGLYQIIARCNFFMDHAEEVRATLNTENERKTMDKFEGDVRFLRAFAYSDLIRTFCVAYDSIT